MNIYVCTLQTSLGDQNHGSNLSSKVFPGGSMMFITKTTLMVMLVSSWHVTNLLSRYVYLTAHLNCVLDK